MELTNNPSSTARTMTLLSVVLVVAILYFAREVLIPVALAVLVSFLLAPLMVRLRHWGMGRIPAMVTVVALAFGGMTIITGVVLMQLVFLARDLPQHQKNIQGKIQSIHLPNDGIFSRITRMVQVLNKEWSDSTRETSLAEEVQKPIPVEIKREEGSAIQVARGLLGSLAGPVTTAAMVVVFVMFILLQREDLRDRLIKLAGPGQINLTTQLLDDAAQRVSRYLFMQLAINVTYGIPVGLGLYFIGVPSPALWALLATLLRFIPFLGPVIAAFLPLLLSFAVDPGWTKPLWTLGLFVALELFSNNVMEPWLYSACTGISTVAIILAAAFWTWLWGPIGLLLSTPLTVCLVVIGRYIPHLEFLSVALGDEPVLPLESRFYQRLLANDLEEAAELAETYLKDHTLVDFYDNILIPALTLAEKDRHQGALTEARQRFIIQGARDIIEDLGSREEGTAALTTGAGAPSPFVLCLPARDEVDEIAATMLVQLLHHNRIPAQALSAEALTTEYLELIAKNPPYLVCISAVPPSALAHARYLCKRLKQRFPDMKVVVGLWTTQNNASEIASRLNNVTTGPVTTNLRTAITELQALIPVEGGHPVPLSQQSMPNAIAGTNPGTVALPNPAGT